MGTDIRRYTYRIMGCILPLIENPVSNQLRNQQLDCDLGIPVTLYTIALGWMNQEARITRPKDVLVP